LVGSKQKYLNHVNQNERHHEIGAPSVHRADEPSKRYVVVQSLETAPRLTGGGNIDERQKNAGNQLQEKYGECGTPEHIKPACRVSRDTVFRGFANRSCELQAPIEPLSNLRDYAHGGFFPVRAALGPGVKSSPAWIVTRPFSILCGYSKSPRSGGPDARPPSR